MNSLFIFPPPRRCKGPCINPRCQTMPHSPFLSKAADNIPAQHSLKTCSAQQFHFIFRLTRVKKDFLWMNSYFQGRNEEQSALRGNVSLQPSFPSKTPLGTWIHFFASSPSWGLWAPRQCWLVVWFSRCIAPCKDWREYCHRGDGGETNRKTGKKRGFSLLPSRKSSLFWEWWIYLMGTGKLEFIWVGSTCYISREGAEKIKEALCQSLSPSQPLLELPDGSQLREMRQKEMQRDLLHYHTKQFQKSAQAGTILPSFSLWPLQLS